MDGAPQGEPPRAAAGDGGDASEELIATDLGNSSTLPLPAQTSMPAENGGEPEHAPTAADPAAAAIAGNLVSSVFSELGLQESQAAAPTPAEEAVSRAGRHSPHEAECAAEAENAWQRSGAGAPPSGQACDSEAKGEMMSAEGPQHFMIQDSENPEAAEGEHEVAEADGATPQAAPGQQAEVPGDVQPDTACCPAAASPAEQGGSTVALTSDLPTGAAESHPASTAEPEVLSGAELGTAPAVAPEASWQPPETDDTQGGAGNSSQHAEAPMSSCGSSETTLPSRGGMEGGDPPVASPPPPPPLPQSQSQSADGPACPTLPAGSGAAAQESGPAAAAGAELLGDPLQLDVIQYGKQLERAVSAKLMLVLSEQQLGGAAGWEDEPAGSTTAAVQTATAGASVVGGAAEAPRQMPHGTAMLAGPVGGLVVQTGMAPPVGEWCLPAGVAVVPAAPAPAARPGSLLNWSPASSPKKGSPGRQKLSSSAPTATATTLPQPQHHSPGSPTQRHRMAPLAACSPDSPAAAGTAAARACGRVKGVSAPANSPAVHMPPLSHTAAGSPKSTVPGNAGQRQLTRPSVAQILASAGVKTRTAPPEGSPGRPGHKLATPAHQLHSTQQWGMAGPPAAFPVLAKQQPEAMVHWGKPPAFQGAASGMMPAAADLPVPHAARAVPPAVADTFFPPLPAPAQQLPVESEAGDVDASAAPTAPPASSRGAAYLGDQAGVVAAAAASGSEPGAIERGEVGAQGNEVGKSANVTQPSQPEVNPGWDDGGQGQLAPGGQPAPVNTHAQCQRYQQYQAVDVSASWPPFEGTKLPPLHQDQVNEAGLIPAMHTASSFAAVPRSGRQPIWAQQAPGPANFATNAAAYYLQMQQVPLMYAAAAQPQGSWLPASSNAAVVPPGQVGQAGQEQPNGSCDVQQQQQAMYLQQQQAMYEQQRWHYEQQQAFLQQQYQQQYFVQQYQQQQYQYQKPSDEQLFYKEPLPQVPVALDPSGRPFKVFHGVAARRLHRPARYQSDGRPEFRTK